MGTVTMPGEVISMAGETADKLLRLGQGDAALLYVSLLRRGGDLRLAEAALGWTPGRLEAAYAALQTAGLVGPAPLMGDRAARSDVLPEYATADITAALDGDNAFQALRDRTEQLLGSRLSMADLKQLYLIYDYAALPPEVVLVLETWCVEEMERKYGPGRRPRMSQIKKHAFRWRDSGIDTLAAAEEHLKAQSGLRERERELLPRLGIRGRAPLDKERDFLAAWIDWGFSDEAILLAYERTLLKKQSMSWPYMNSILKNWHGKGLHTPAEIDRGDQTPSYAPRSGPQRVSTPGEGQVARELEELRRAAGKES